MLECCDCHPLSIDTTLLYYSLNLNNEGLSFETYIILYNNPFLETETVPHGKLPK